MPKRGRVDKILALENLLRDDLSVLVELVKDRYAGGEFEADCCFFAHAIADERRGLSVLILLSLLAIDCQGGFREGLGGELGNLPMSSSLMPSMSLIMALNEFP